MRVFVKRPGENFVEQHAIGNPRWIATLIIGEPVDYYVNDDYGMIVYRQMDQTGSPDNACLGDVHCGIVVAFGHAGYGTKKPTATDVPHKCDYLLAKNYPDWSKINDFWSN